MESTRKKLIRETAAGEFEFPRAIPQYTRSAKISRLQFLIVLKRKEKDDTFSL